MAAKMSVRTAGGVTKMARIEALLLKIFEMALKGDTRAQLQLLNLYAAAVPEPSSDAFNGEVTDAEDLGLQKLQELSREFLTKSLEGR